MIVNIQNGVQTSYNRKLNEFPILIRSNNAISIIDKVMKAREATYDGIVSTQRPFGLRTYARPEIAGDLILRWNGGKGPFPSKKIHIGNELIDKWKVVVSRVVFEHAGKTDKDGRRRVLSVLELLQPKEICSETYIVVDSFTSKREAENLLSYLKTKFVRFLIVQIASSIMITKSCFRFVPVQDFSKSWTDAELYTKYDLTNDEIIFIESMIRPMGTEGGDENG